MSFFSGVGEYLVGVLDLFELLLYFCSSIRVFVGMILESHLLIRPLDGFLISVRL